MYCLSSHLDFFSDPCEQKSIVAKDLKFYSITNVERRNVKEMQFYQGSP